MAGMNADVKTFPIRTAKERSTRTEVLWLGLLILLLVWEWTTEQSLNLFIVAMVLERHSRCFSSSLAHR
jgi:hypothetical protein